MERGRVLVCKTINNSSRDLEGPRLFVLFGVHGLTGRYGDQVVDIIHGAAAGEVVGSTINLLKRRWLLRSAIPTISVRQSLPSRSRSRNGTIC